ncbi:hypothetical protein BH23GEM3_BH23GEM3_11930 [soil metagenome]
MEHDPHSSVPVMKYPGFVALLLVPLTSPLAAPERPLGTLHEQAQIRHEWFHLVR